MYRRLRSSKLFSLSLRLRLALFAMLCLAACAASMLVVPASFSATPASGTVSESNPTVTWTGAIMPANPDLLNSPRCAGANSSACDNFGITVVPPSAAYGPYVVEIRLQPQGDWDMEIYNPNGNYRTGSGNGVGAAEIVTLYNPAAGTYRIAAFPFAPVVGSDANSYAASAELKHQPPSGSSPAATENVSYATFACPAGQTCTSGFGEPSIGSNWKTGSVMFAGGGTLKTYRVNFNDQASPTSATWTNVSGNQHIATSPRAFADPILFTDPRTGRTFADQLEGLTPFSTMEYTDDDGNLFIPSQGSGIASGVDHQTIGGGPLAAPLTRDPNLPRPAYPNAVYYCAQALGPANCALSLDGGETFGPSVPTWTTECGGIHGHVMVAPNDGTVYVPNRGCGGRQGMAVSTDNGISWAIRTIPGTGTGESDPSVGVATDGTVYFGFVDGDGHPKVAVTHDKGLNWDTLGGAKFIDVGIPFGIQNAVFAATVAGDPQRAAFAFHGTPTAGPFQDSSFNGVWDLYVANTFDGGATWTTLKTTANPTQRGCIWLGGGDNPCRNLLDFMGATVDQEGRVIVGYADGCTGGCATDPNDTSKSVWGTIARQSGGKRMFAAFDPGGDPTPTPTPAPTPTPQSACVLPGITLITDASGDTGVGSLGTVPGTPAQDITEVLIAEPQQSDGISRIAVTMRVADLTALPASGMWRVFFTSGAATYFVGAFNDPVSGAMQYTYGTSGTVTTTVGPADSGSIDVAKKTITVFISNSKVGSPAAGSVLSGIYSRTQTLVGASGTGATPTHDLAPDTAPTSGTPNYALVGNGNCGSPTPTPTATPTPNPTATPTPNPTPTPGGEGACATPGITVVNDASGDQLPAVGSTKHDIQKISIAEPYSGPGVSNLIFTMKVADLNGTLPANTQWKVYFTSNGTNYWVAMLTNGSSVVSYKYGTSANNLDTTVGDPDGGTYKPDGTITLTLANSRVGSPGAGQSLTTVFGEAYMLVGVLLTEIDFAGDGTYTLVGNASCGVSPTPTPSVSPTATPTPSATPTPQPGVPAYINYYPPSGVAEDFGEPSIGSNWKSGKIMFFGGFSPYALRVSFNDATTPATVTWDPTQLRLAGPQRVYGDPILFTDRDTGRTFVSQLFGATPFNGMDMTDDDGATYLPSQGSGIGSGIDHQTVGGGPFHAPVPTGAAYEHSVYYCAQDALNSNDTGIANCALSIDGGLTFGPAVPVYALAYNECFPLHGHLKVGPDGTTYLPNRKCGAGAGLVLSEDNGITWSARTVPNSTVGDSDASLGIATDGTLFLGYEGSNGHPYISVSRDKGTTWSNPFDVGTQAGLQNAIFPAVVAGDGGANSRAAFAYYGSASPGDQDDPAFRGAWYLYISSTFDGGNTWTTVNATPGDPMQRDGICTRGFQGCVVPRNLLDFFDATVDKEGRVLVGYQDGCMGACVQSGPNSNTRKGVIARQSSGKRMFAQYDSGNPTPTPTPTPTPSATPTPTPGPITPVYQKGGITFSPNVTTRASVAGRDGEPSLRVDKFGNAYVAGIRGVPAGVDLWYFDLNPSSSTYDPLMRNPIYRGQPDQFSPDEAIELGADGGGDVDLAVGFDEATPGNPPYLAFSSLTAANISTARSTDRGATFMKNPAGNVTGGVPADDRQWMEAFGKNSVYLLYRTLEPVTAYVQRSDDGGFTYGPATQVGSVGQVGGISVDQNDGTVYVSGSNGVVAVGTPAGPGQAPSSYTIRTVGGGAHIFFTVKAAKDGTVYVCYSDGRTVYIKYSRDKGATWSPAVRVSDGPETATGVLPWIETGPTPGSIGVVWYGSTASSNNDNANWKVFFAQSLNATSSSPVFRQVELSDHFIHGSNISEGGLPLLPGNAPNRNLLDYFQIAFDPTGAAVVAYTDDHNDFDGHVYVARQTSGPGVLGTDIPAPVNGSALPQPTPRPANAPQVVDFAQDHRNGLLTVLPVNDPLDILSVKYSTEGPATAPVLVATMKVSDLSTVPPLSNWRMNFTANAPDSRMSPNGDYSFGLSDRGDQFFLRATTDALGTRTFTYGTAVREHQHRGFIAYTDRGTADSGTIDSATGLITIKIALSKLNATLAAGHAPIGPGSILAGLRGGTFTTGDDNAADRNDRAKSDITRGGIQYAINSAPTAALTANPASGTVPLAVTLDGSGSSDPDPGDTLSYTFNFGDGSAAVTQNSAGISHTYNNAGSYTATLKVKDANGWESNTATVTITVNAPQPPVVTCSDDDDAKIAYSGGWHLINNTSASGGHFRYHTGNSPQHFASFDFNVPSGSTGSLTYSFAKSPKGGTADVYLDGVWKATINYAGSVGSTQAPEFNPAYTLSIGNIPAGARKLEIKNMNGVVYLDRICLQNATSTSQPTSGPGNTSNQSGSASAGQTSSSNYQTQPGSQEISVSAESSLNVPFKVVLVDPSGLTLQTANSTSGIATISQPVTQGGIYVIKVVNLSLGPLQFTVTSTPTVQR